MWQPSQWNTGKPSAPGIYIGLAEARSDAKPSLYTWDGDRWQHWTGFYDGVVSHWMLTDLPMDGASKWPRAQLKEIEMDRDNNQELEDARLTAIGLALHHVAQESGEWVAFHEWPGPNAGRAALAASGEE